jgi:hypothetical protein
MVVPVATWRAEDGSWPRPLRVDSDGTVLLCLHQLGARASPLTVATTASRATESFCLFRSTTLTWLCQRRALVDQLEEKSHVNPNTRTTGLSL